jgi:hypothetical protein
MQTQTGEVIKTKFRTEDLDPVAVDLAATLSALPGHLIEISEADQGGSKFNRATYLDRVSPEQILHFARLDRNMGFLVGIDPDKLTAPHGEVTKRSARDEHVDLKNIISVECDFKDVIDGFKELPTDQKRTIAEGYFRKHYPALKGQLGELWLAVYTGNSIHFHFKLRRPLDCSDSERYSRCYTFLVERMEAIFRGELILDRSCQNPARLMRLPLSTNWKRVEAPIRTTILHHSHEADSSQMIGMIWEAADAHHEQLNASLRAQAAAPEGSDHKAKLKAALTFRSILEHFRYSKFNTLKEMKNGETLCSSPWGRDSEPSCYLNETKKQFKDFSTGKGGDVFTMISQMSKPALDLKTQFPAVLKVAEQITGIQRPPQPVRLATPAADQGAYRSTRAIYEDYITFFEEHLPDLRLDLLSDELMCKHRGEWQPAASRLEVLGSLAIDSNFLREKHLRQHLARYADTKEPQLLVDIPEWDGRDRVHEIARCVKLKNCSQEVFEELLKDWGARLIDRVKNPKAQNRIIVLKGPQGIGKDSLVDSLVGDLGRLATNLTISNNPDNNLAMLADHLVLKISEFDRTAKTDAATLKDWITRDEVTFRRPYAKSHRSHALRCSFIATVNVDEILRDHTGNRRFIIFDMESIKWEYPTDQSLQVLAQFRALSASGYKPSSDSQETMKAYVQEQTPDDPKEAILEDFDARMLVLENGTPHMKGRFPFDMVRSELADIRQIHSMKMPALLQMLKGNGRSHRTNRGPVYFRKESAPD